MTVTQSTFAYRIERRDPSGNEVQHVATADYLTVAPAIYKAACERWPNNSLTFIDERNDVLVDRRHGHSGDGGVRQELATAIGPPCHWRGRWRARLSANEIRCCFYRADQDGIDRDAAA
jgi:hypothetical protein